ncbi:hypothetical protein GHA01_31950 [Novacetimonas hansenii]|uniref:Uncharacterized protein n=1 Tax=Novacetimonas hansenii TaxID=436 RepID=A0ABQ0SMX6_NOVHA|nr:hypothetical protein Gaha_0041_002 [Novacetimonas hansenii JCM 7643]GEC65346.1 hypothetical protein GHA01_31950 [Novacetimonas hansenii]
MPLLALDPLAGVKAGRIDAPPPFSALLTLWLSMIAAVGLALRPAWNTQQLPSKGSLQEDNPLIPAFLEKHSGK